MRFGSSTATLRRENEKLRRENDELKREIEALRRRLVVVSAASAWEPFEALMQSSGSADVVGGDKLVMPAKYFLFGQTKAFMDGLPGMLTGGLLRSMAEEARDNEGGKWLAEFEYVVNREAVEDVPDLITTAKFKGKPSSSGNIIVRDHGHSGMTLADFCSHEMALAAELTEAEVAALRLYSGPMFAPLNYALRTENISDWATTIGCCYSGVLKLSFLSQPARVYRGVKEDEMRLPAQFLNREEGKFAGGVERAFMSTTKSAAVALDYSGGGAASGSIFAIDFDMNSRGASIQFLSQYPHEEELLFPPCTGLACLDVSQHGRKRCVLVSAQVSTARLDTRELVTPTHVPGTAVALQWAAEVLFEKSSVEEIIGKEEWNLRGRNLSHGEHAERVALLLGRAATVAAPRVRVVDLRRSQLSPAGGAAIGKALKVNAALTSLDVGGNSLTEEAALSIVRIERQRNKLTSLGLAGCSIGPTGAAEIAEYVSGSEVLQALDICGNKIGDQGGVAIAEALRGNRVLTKLNLDGDELDLPKLRGTDSVTSLYPSNNRLGPASAIVIASLVTGNKVLKTLNMHTYSAAGITALAEAIKVNDVLTNLNLYYDKIGDEGAKALASALRVNEVLTDLDLGQNKIGDEGANALASGLRVNGALKILHIGCNKIGPKGAAAIAEALRGNEVLTNLNLMHNNIGDEGAAALASALRVNGVLKNIDLCHNSLGDEGKGVIRDAVSGREGFKLMM